MAAASKDGRPSCLETHAARAPRHEAGRSAKYTQRIFKQQTRHAASPLLFAARGAPSFPIRALKKRGDVERRKAPPLECPRCAKAQDARLAIDALALRRSTPGLSLRAGAFAAF
jgi:hypothetical protein